MTFQGYPYIIFFCEKTLSGFEGLWPDRLNRTRAPLGSRMSRFKEVQVVLPITRKNRNIKALNLYFSAVKSSRARNSKTEWVFDNSYGVACRRSLKLGADRAPGRRSGIRANSERHSRI